MFWIMKKIKKHWDLSEMINSKFPILALQPLRPGRANKNSALVIEIFFWSVVLRVHYELQFYYHPMQVLL